MSENNSQLLERIQSAYIHNYCHLLFSGTGYSLVPTYISQPEYLTIYYNVIC